MTSNLLGTEGVFALPSFNYLKGRQQVQTQTKLWVPGKKYPDKDKFNYHCAKCCNKNVSVMVFGTLSVVQLWTKMVPRHSAWWHTALSHSMCHYAESMNAECPNVIMLSAQMSLCWVPKCHYAEWQTVIILNAWMLHPQMSLCRVYKCWVSKCHPIHFYVSI